MLAIIRTALWQTKSICSSAGFFLDIFGWNFAFNPKYLTDSAMIYQLGLEDADSMENHLYEY